MSGPLFQAIGLGKTYAEPVLADLSLDLQPGEVHAVVGENGAGKSTFARIVAGVAQPNAGTMRLRGAPYAPRDRAAGRAAGVAFVMQELNLVGTLTVAEQRLGRPAPGSASPVSTPGAPWLPLASACSSSSRSPPP